jgi:hypothetical protein
MTHLSKRLDRLEAQRGGGAVAVPSVIFIAEPDGEVIAALFVGGSGSSRLGSESEAAFISRAEKEAFTNDQKGDIWGDSSKL